MLKNYIARKPEHLDRCSISEIRSMLDNMVFDKHIRPHEFISGTSVTRITTWTELSIIFVKWLIENKFISLDKVPISNSASNGKYFINTVASHRIQEKDGLWHRVAPYFVDTKYNATSHIRNILFTLKHLNLHNPDFKISFRQN